METKSVIENLPRKRYVGKVRGGGYRQKVSAIHCLGVTDIGLNELVDRGLIFAARQGTDLSFAVKSTGQFPTSCVW